MLDVEEQLTSIPNPPPVSEEERAEIEQLKALLINNEGDITDKLELALLRIFARFSSSYRLSHPSLSALDPSTSLPRPSKQDTLTASDLDEFALATNGSPFLEEAKEEIQEYLDTDDDGNLTFRGFCEMFHLQSDNEPQETWKDLSKCGFDDQLVFVGVEKDKHHDEIAENNETPKDNVAGNKEVDKEAEERS